jgi:AcrR family transcriptional regulator
MAKSPKYLRWEDRERQIIDKSIEYFAEYGFSASTRDIAAHIGIAQPLLYRYFPSKQALIDRVYKDVFLLSWKEEWNTIIRDRTRPLRMRLIDYLTSYCDTILAREWVRIFLFGALADTSINERFINLLQKHTFTAILEELYHENKISLPRNSEDQQLDYEIVWGFHSSFFYMGIRRWVYKLPVPTDLRPVIRARVSAFLDGIGSELTRNRP